MNYFITSKDLISLDFAYPTQIQSGLPRNLVAAIHRYGTSSFPKAPMVTMLDIHGKTAASLNYGKLYTKVMKIAYSLLYKIGTKTDPLLRPGDKVGVNALGIDRIAFAMYLQV